MENKALLIGRVFRKDEINMDVFIITGASRGLGNSIAKKLVEENNYLFCISRKSDTNLISYAKEKQCNLDFFEFDLSNVYEIDKLMNSIFDKLKFIEVDSISLINNAGIITPVKTIENCTDSEIINNIHVNLLAPIILTSAFIKNTKSFEGNKKIINISSGAGSKPYYGWTNYCAAKAGINLFTQCVGVEQNQNANPVKIVSLTPYIMDTEMQEEIRRTGKEDFEQVERFREFKKDGKLLSVDFVAERVIKLLSEEFVQGKIIDVMDVI